MENIDFLIKVLHVLSSIATIYSVVRDYTKS